MNEWQMRYLNRMVERMESGKYDGETLEQWKKQQMPWQLEEFNDEELAELWENVNGAEDIKIGTPCTIILYSDRRAATVVSVERTKAGNIKRIGVVENDYERGYGECEVKEELEGDVEYYTLRRNGKGWYAEGQKAERGSVRLHIGSARTYIDPSF